MKIAVLGCGLIGKKRGSRLEGHRLVGVYDPNRERASALGAELGGVKAYGSEVALLKESGADAAIIATTNNQLFPMARLCLEHGKHVLVEKPGGIRLAELEELEALSRKVNKAVKVGFNHRFHPALLKAREIVDSGMMGELMYLRAQYGHGARVGYEKEWRSIPEIGGGGELLDQGVHLLDLIYWFMGPLPLKDSLVRTSFWPMKVDDNAVLTLADERRWATFHVSCSEWKNGFRFELYGRIGKILIQGLGGSYGKETLTYYQMLPEMGPPKVSEFEFGPDDRSWELDLKNLVDHVEHGKPLWGELASARYALTQVREAYRANGFTHLPCSV